MAASRARRTAAVIRAELQADGAPLEPVVHARPAPVAAVDEQVARAFVEAKSLAGVFARLGSDARPALAWRCTHVPRRSPLPSTRLSGRTDHGQIREGRRSAALEVEVVPIDALTLDPRNARKHGRRNLDAIKASLEQFGQRRPLVVRADLQVIAGNGTLEAIRDLRWSEVAVTRVPADWTDDQVRAYALADNRTAELAEWDDVVLADMLAELDAGGWDLNSIGFDGLPELAPGDADDEVPDTDEAAPTAKLGDVWELGEHRVACGSSTDIDAVAALFGGRPADLVITDPPYGVDYVANKEKTAAIRGQTTGKHRDDRERRALV